MGSTLSVYAFAHTACATKPRHQADSDSRACGAQLRRAASPHTRARHSFPCGDSALTEHGIDALIIRASASGHSPVLFSLYYLTAYAQDMGASAAPRRAHLLEARRQRHSRHSRLRSGARRAYQRASVGAASLTAAMGRVDICVCTLPARSLRSPPLSVAASHGISQGDRIAASKRSEPR